jgi:hypothetical protein
MAIFSGSTEIQKVYSGGTEIQKVYSGSTLVWENERVAFAEYAPYSDPTSAQWTEGTPGTITFGSRADSRTMTANSGGLPGGYYAYKVINDSWSSGEQLKIDLLVQDLNITFTSGALLDLIYGSSHTGSVVQTFTVPAGVSGSTIPNTYLHNFGSNQSAVTLRIRTDNPSFAGYMGYVNLKVYV